MDAAAANWRPCQDQPAAAGPVEGRQRLPSHRDLLPALGPRGHDRAPADRRAARAGCGDLGGGPRGAAGGPPRQNLAWRAAARVRRPDRLAPRVGDPTDQAYPSRGRPRRGQCRRGGRPACAADSGAAGRCPRRPACGGGRSGRRRAVRPAGRPAGAGPGPRGPAHPAAAPAAAAGAAGGAALRRQHGRAYGALAAARAAAGGPPARAPLPADAMADWASVRPGRPTTSSRWCSPSIRCWPRCWPSWPRRTRWWRA
jgi:hypothetical protein